MGLSDILKLCFGTKTMPIEQPSQPPADPWIKAEPVFIKIGKRIPIEHWSTLYRKRVRLNIKDDYGEIDSTDWDNEKKNYINKYIIPQMDESMIRAIVSWCYAISEEAWRYDNNGLLVLALSPFLEDNLNTNIELFAKLNDIGPNTSRPNNPIEYEHYCGDLLRKHGWEVAVTKASGDQGADIRASKGQISIVAQCKLYNSPVGNKAVQEVFASQKYYSANHGVVVTNNRFTKSARQLAASNGVLLINDCEICKLEDLLSNTTGNQPRDK